MTKKSDPGNALEMLQAESKAKAEAEAAKQSPQYLLEQLQYLETSTPLAHKAQTLAMAENTRVPEYQTTIVPEQQGTTLPEYQTNKLPEHQSSMVPEAER